MSACVQAIYSYIGVTEFYTDFIRKNMENDEVLKRYGLSSLMSTSAYNILRINNGYELLTKELKVAGDAGAAFFDGFLKNHKRVIDKSIELIEPYKKQYNLKWTRE
jgi:hypothetical protein